MYWYAKVIIINQMLFFYIKKLTRINISCVKPICLQQISCFLRLKNVKGRKHLQNGILPCINILCDIDLW